MFTEILKIIPKMDEGSLNLMVTKLNSRFGSVAKKFGKGLAGIFKGGGLAGGIFGAATVLFDKLLNPLKDVQEAIDRSLAKADDMSTFANQFGSSSGELARLTAVGEATGLDKDSLYMLINKFQATVAEAEKDPNKDTSVRGFVGSKNMVDAFYTFIQNLQKLDKNQQLLVQQEVFGEKQILKMADFIGSDLPQLLKQIGGPSSKNLTRSIERQAGLNDLQDRLAASRNLQDIMTKGGLITDQMIRQRDQNERAELERQNTQIKGYMAMAQVNETATKIMGLVDTVVVKLGNLITEFEMFGSNVKGFIQDLKNSRMFRGLFGGK